MASSLHASSAPSLRRSVALRPEWPAVARRSATPSLRRSVALRPEWPAVALRSATPSLRRSVALRPEWPAVARRSTTPSLRRSVALRPEWPAVARPLPRCRSTLQFRDCSGIATDASRAGQRQVAPKAAFKLGAGQSPSHARNVATRTHNRHELSCLRVRAVRGHALDTPGAAQWPA